MRCSHFGRRMNSPAGPPVSRRPGAVALGVVCWTWCGAVAADPPVAPEAGQWLYEHAVVYRQSVAQPTPDDVGYMLVWLDAATAISPSAPDAYRAKAELLAAAERYDEARTALTTYSRLRPDDLEMRRALIALSAAEARTAEEHLAVMTHLLEAGDLPVALQAEVHRDLAALYATRLEKDMALAHARVAAQLDPGDIAAQKLVAEIEGREEAPAARVRWLLAEVSETQHWLPRWQLSQTLDALGDYESALQWHALAEQGFVRAWAPATAPVDGLLLDRAWLHFNNARFEKAFSLSADLLNRRPSDTEAEMLLIQSLRAMGRIELADRHAAGLAARLRERERQAVERRDAETLRHLAEFHLDIAPDARRALEFAKLASRFATANLRAKLVLGRAYAATGAYEAAIAKLRDDGLDDQRAAVALARAQAAQDDRTAALQTLRQAERIRVTGPTYDAVVALLDELGEKPAAKPDLGGVRDALAAFDRRVFEFADRAGELVDFQVVLPHQSYGYDQPIEARLTLTNKAPYDLVLGPGRMLEGRVAVDLKDTARGGAHLVDYLDVAFAAGRLAAGESVERQQRLDDAVSRMLLRYQPQRRRSCAATFTLDPVMTPEGVTTCGLRGVAPVVVAFERRPVDASPEAVRRMVDVLRTGTDGQRARTIELLLALIVERRESFGDDPHTYAATKVDVAALTQLIVAGLGDSSPAVRARALWALAYLPLDEGGIASAAPLLSDRHWLPRLLAIELFAKKQGPVFLPVLESLAGDPHPIVARLAGLYQEQILALRRAARR